MRTSSLWWSCEKLGLSSIEWTGREELSGIGDKRKLLRLFSVTSALENRTTRHECFPCSAKQSTEHNLGIKRLSRPEKETEILTEEIPLAVCRRIRAAPYPGTSPLDLASAVYEPGEGIMNTCGRESPWSCVRRIAFDRNHIGTL